jgi:hypothetical protein
LHQEQPQQQQYPPSDFSPISEEPSIQASGSQYEDDDDANEETKADRSKRAHQQPQKLGSSAGIKKNASKIGIGIGLAGKKGGKGRENSKSRSKERKPMVGMTGTGIKHDLGFVPPPTE